MVVKRYTNSGTGSISLSNMTGGYNAYVANQHEVMSVPSDYTLRNDDPSGSHTALTNLASLGVNGIRVVSNSDFEVWIGVGDVVKIPPIYEKYEANVGYTKIYILGDGAKENNAKLVFCLKNTNTTKTKLPISDVTSIERYTGWTKYVGQICNSVTDTLSFTTVSGLAINASQLKTVASSGSTMYYIPYFDTYNGSNFTNRSSLIFKIPTSGGALSFYDYPYNVFEANKDVSGHPVADTWLEDGYRYYKLNFGAYSTFNNIIVTGNANQITEITREKLIWDNYNPYIYSATASEWVNNPYFDKIYGYKYDVYGNRLSYYYYYTATDVAKCWRVEPGTTYRIKIKGQDAQAYSKFNIVMTESYDGSGAFQQSVSSMTYDATEDVMYTDVTINSGMNFLWITNTSGYFSWLNGIADDITIGEKQATVLTPMFLYKSGNQYYYITTNTRDPQVLTTGSSSYPGVYYTEIPVGTQTISLDLASASYKIYYGYSITPNTTNLYDLAGMATVTFSNGYKHVDIQLNSATTNIIYIFPTAGVTTSGLRYTKPVQITSGYAE